MSEPFLAEIRMFAGNFAPSGNMFCNGQLLSISQYSAVFSLVGTYYGGNGTTNFNLPNLQSRVPIHQGTGAGLSPYTIGQAAGEVNHTLLSNEIGSHTHTLNGVDTATTTNPGVTVQPGNEADYPNYLATAANTAMGASALSPFGGGLAHSNVQPVLAINFIFAMQGIYPSRN